MRGRSRRFLFPRVPHILVSCKKKKSKAFFEDIIEAHDEKKTIYDSMLCDAHKNRKTKFFIFFILFIVVIDINLCISYGNSISTIRNEKMIGNCLTHLKLCWI